MQEQRVKCSLLTLTTVEYQYDVQHTVLNIAGGVFRRHNMAVLSAAELTTLNPNGGCCRNDRYDRHRNLSRKEQIMKPSIDILIIALEDSIANHEKEGGYEWTVAQMQQTLDLIRGTTEIIIKQKGQQQ